MAPIRFPRRAARPICFFVTDSKFRGSGFPAASGNKLMKVGSIQTGIPTSSGSYDTSSGLAWKFIANSNKRSEWEVKSLTPAPSEIEGEGFKPDDWKNK